MTSLCILPMHSSKLHSSTTLVQSANCLVNISYLNNSRNTRQSGEFVRGTFTLCRCHRIQQRWLFVTATKNSKIQKILTHKQHIVSCRTTYNWKPEFLKLKLSHIDNLLNRKLAANAQLLLTIKKMMSFQDANGLQKVHKAKTKWCSNDSYNEQGAHGLWSTDGFKMLIHTHF